MAYITKRFDVFLCSDAYGEEDIRQVGTYDLRIYEGSTTLSYVSGLSADEIKAYYEQEIGDTSPNFICFEPYQENVRTFLSDFIGEGWTMLPGFPETAYLKLQNGNYRAISENKVTWSQSSLFGLGQVRFKCYDANLNKKVTTDFGIFGDPIFWILYENITDGIVSGSSTQLHLRGINPSDSLSGIEGVNNYGNFNWSGALEWLNGIENAPEEPADPYAAGGTSTTGGGTGNFDATSDIISIPNLPTISAIDTGFLTLFAPSLSQLQSLQQYLWGDLYQGVADGSLTETVESLKKLVANPYDAILGLSLVPVSIPTAGSKDVKMYGVLNSGVSMPYASSQWATVDCGTLNINEFWGAYLDYAPYTKVTSLYLPYVGTVSVDVDEIMGKALRVVYHVDILSGQCIAYIIINGSVEYQYQGHCSTSIPVTASDFSNAILSGLNLVGSATSVIAGGISGGLGGGIAGAITGAVSQAASQAPAVASNVMGMKPDIKAGGSVGGSGGLLSVQKPYLIAIRPRQSVAENQNSFTGYPVNMKLSVGSCSGYTEFETINLDGIPLTQPEKEELESILKGGVYL